MKLKKITLITIVFTLLLAVEGVSQVSAWKSVDDGLSIGEFSPPLSGYTGKARIVVVRIDPSKYQLKLLTAAEYKHPNISTREWCQKYGLIAAINAGMFLPDYKTNVGYMRNFQYINNRRVHRTYLSVAAFNPINSKIPPYQIFDADVTPMEEILKSYQSVVQNLRLIQNPRKNKWSPQAKKWSEAALGQDKDGNILFIFSPAPFSMYDFNEMLLALPLHLISAQHLEGGPEASLFLSHQGITLELAGSFSSTLTDSLNNSNFLPIPNVLGISKKK